jgi:hypothetical protein
MIPEFDRLGFRFGLFWALGALGTLRAFRALSAAFRVDGEGELEHGQERGQEERSGSEHDRRTGAIAQVAGRYKQARDQSGVAPALGRMAVHRSGQGENVNVVAF